jgi:hypothetical protein
MIDTTMRTTRPRLFRWRWAMWGGAAALLMLPAVAMQFTDEVRWNAASFLVIGALLAIGCGLVELGVRLGDHWAYRLGFAAAAFSGFTTIWVNLAVGMIGSEDNDENLLFVGVLFVAACGALLARFRAAGMARAMFVTAAAMAATVVYAALTGHARPAVLMLFWVVAWASAGVLFRIAAAAEAARQEARSRGA